MIEIGIGYRFAVAIELSRNARSSGPTAL